jgi:hypothetical protein
VRYYFDIDLGTGLVKDEEGLVLESELQAREEARRAVAEFAAEAIASPTPPNSVNLWLRNMSGHILEHHTVRYSVSGITG